MLTIVKTFEFEAAHHLERYEGSCNRVHGHSYKLQVEVSGPIIETGPKRGMILDFGDLKKIVNEEVIAILDHQYLNDLFSFDPTAENIVMWASWALKGRLPGLQRIRLHETSTSYCEWIK